MGWFCVGVLTVVGLPTWAVSWQDYQKPVMTSSTDFKTVSNTLAFVDKTLLLRELFSDGIPRPIMVTAPRGFGKTTNLDMVGAFLSTPLDTEGKRLNPNVTELHEIFTRTKIYKTDPHFFYKYFGRFPLLYVDLETVNPLGSLEDLIDMLKQKIHYYFRRHPYIQGGDWMDSSRYIHLAKDQVLGGLGDLVDGFYRHFDGTEVILLIDNYDSLVTAAMTSVGHEELSLIMEEVFRLLTNLMSNNQVRWVLVTGTLPIDGSDTGMPLQMDVFKFLDHHQFSEYFGFLKDEVQSLIRNNKFNLDREETRKASLMYSPYKTSGGKRICCPNSVLKFLKKKKAEAFWDSSFYLDHLITVYKDFELEQAIDSLLQNNTITLKIQKSFTTKDILKLRSMFLGKGSIEDSGTELILNYLFHAGYLTRCEESEGVRLPNHEIQETILEYLWNAHTIDVSKDGR